MHQAEASVTDGVCAIGQFVLDVACAKHRFVTVFGRVAESLFDAALAFHEFSPRDFDAALPRLALPFYTV
jgi:hypothetical protein